MSYHDGHASSTGAKTALLLLTLAGVLLSLPILTKSGKLVSFHSALLLACVTVFYLRLAICLLVFVKRKVGWIEGGMVGILYGILVYMFSVWGSVVADKISIMGIVGVILFVVGAWVNSQSDYQRHKWKKLPIIRPYLHRWIVQVCHAHKLFWRHGYVCRLCHGYTKWHEFYPVAAIFLNFILFQIPSLDNYLLKRYGEEFTNYAHVTSKFIPFIY